jgi:hypothetical protein
MREFRQTSVRFTPGRLLFFVTAWLVVLLAYEGLISPRFHLPYLWEGPVFSALAWMSLVVVIWPMLSDLGATVCTERVLEGLMDRYLIETLHAEQSVESA